MEILNDGFKTKQEVISYDNWQLQQGVDYRNTRNLVLQWSAHNLYSSHNA